jgi:uncharacterized membrane protein YjfL (UPF0719 family)
MGHREPRRGPRHEEDTVLLAEVTVDDVVATVLYGGVGAAMLVVGFVVLDLATPGSFVERIRQDRSRNAGALAIGNLVAVGLVVSVAGFTSDGSVGEGLASMLVYGGLGIALQAVFLLAMSWSLRREMDGLLRAIELDPLALTVAVAGVMVGVVTAVAVS